MSTQPQDHHSLHEYVSSIKQQIEMQLDDADEETRRRMLLNALLDENQELE